MAAPKIEKTDALIGTHLGDYVIQSLIGRGGMARVYEGFDEKLKRRAAVKVIEVEHGDGDDMTQRFVREARSVGSLDHPNIVGVYQFGEAPNLYYLAMKLIEGDTLQVILRRKRKQKQFLPSADVIKILTETAAAIDHAHKQGVIHRDIKPSNIIVSNEGRTILTDFGLSMQLQDDSTLGTAFGTPRYIAPEQAISSHRAVPQSDIYSLGIVLYEMLTGQTPFDNDSPMSLALSHISSPPPAPRSIRPDLPEPVEKVILKALEKKPENRWQTATQMAEALRKAFDGIDPGIVLTQEPLDMPTPGQPPRTDASEPSVPAPIQPSGPAPTEILPQIPVEQPARRRRPIVLYVALLVSLLMLAGATAYALAPVSIRLPSFAATATLQPRLRLLYNKDMLVIYNPTGQTVSLEGYSFRRSDSRSQSYAAAAFGESSHKTFRAGQCLGMRRVGPDRPLPDACGSDFNPLNFDDANIFWAMRSETDPVTTFVIQKNDQVVQTCSMRQNTCEFPN